MKIFQTLLVIAVQIFYIGLIQSSEAVPLENICRSIINKNSADEMEDCKTLLQQTYEEFGDTTLNNIVSRFVKSKNTYGDLKIFFQDVIFVDGYGCKADCVLYLSDCIGLKPNSICSWIAVLKFSSWNLLSRIRDVNDKSKYNLCNNIIDLLLPSDNIGLLFFYDYYLQEKSDPPRCNFVQIKAIAKYFNSKQLWGANSESDENRKENVIDLFMVICGTSWSKDAINHVIVELTNVKVSLNCENKKKAIWSVFKNIDSKLIEKQNFNIESMLPLLEDCEKQSCLIEYSIQAISVFQKANEDPLSVKNYIEKAEGNHHVANSLIICLDTELVKGKDVTFEENFKNLLTISAYMVDPGHSVVELCQVLRKKWGISNRKMLFDVWLELIHNGYSPLEGLGFFENASIIGILKEEETKIKFQSDHLMKLSLLQFITKKHKMNPNFNSFKNRRIDLEEFHLMHYNFDELSRKAVGIFFSDSFEKVPKYETCPVSVVVTTLTNYDKHFNNHIPECVLVELINHECVQFNNKDSPKKLINFAINSYLDEPEVVNLTHQFSVQFLDKFSESLQGFSAEILRTILKKLTLEEMEKLPEFLEWFSEYSMPRGIWTDQELADWLELIVKLKVENFGREFLQRHLQNLQCSITFILDSLSEMKDDEMRLLSLKNTTFIVENCPELKDVNAMIFNVSFDN